MIDIVQSSASFLFVKDKPNNNVILGLVSLYQKTSLLITKYKKYRLLDWKISGAQKVITKVPMRTYYLLFCLANRFFSVRKAMHLYSAKSVSFLFCRLYIF